MPVFALLPEQILRKLTPCQTILYKMNLLRSVESEVSSGNKLIWETMQKNKLILETSI